MNQHRQQYRIPIERSGQLTRLEVASECHVSDLTEQGFQVRTELPLGVGEVLGLTCALEGDAEIRCTIAVTHTRPHHFGTRIIEMSSEDRERLSRFIQRLITVNMIGL